MSRVVYKYEVPIDGQIHRLPYGLVLHAGPRVIPATARNSELTDHDTALVWVEHDLDAAGNVLPEPNGEMLEVTVVGTGHLIDDDDLWYVTSWAASPFVWHLYKKDAT